MAPSRRDFIKFIVAGSVAAGCPLDKTLLAAAHSKSPSAPLVHGEQFEVCLANVQDLISGGDAKRAILPGGLGCITHKLVEVLQPKYKEGMLDNAAVVAAVQDEDAVRAPPRLF
ncbi:MAG: hypothetical protein DMG49_18035 [Acidobacteria bacterium]|nr:MAG: hypothetical protein DMG49_18035 [Acidobacteriota bacterium]